MYIYRYCIKINITMLVQSRESTWLQCTTRMGPPNTFHKHQLFATQGCVLHWSYTGTQSQLEPTPSWQSKFPGKGAKSRLCVMITI